MKIKEQVADLHDELIHLRRDFHKYPELGFEEKRTSEKVADYLRTCGIKVKRLAKTGVVGLLNEKKPGRTLLLRADMDALPIQEMNEIHYKSVHEGKMHACGHDGHMAMLLVAAKILSRLKDELKANVKFVFEPNEENVAARKMIEEGVLEDPKVDAALGIHLWTPIESGKIGIVSGPVMAAMEHFRLIIRGKGGHTASPHNAIDPIITAANIIQTVQVTQTREIDVLKPTLIMFGKITGGTASNVIPENVEIDGTLRYLYGNGEDNNERPKERFERIVNNICKAYRAECELTFLYGHPAVINDSKMADLVRTCAEGIVGRLNLVSFISMAGEDFSEFAVRVPSALYFIGAGNEKKETHYPHHHPRFNIDEDVLPNGVEMHVRTALRFLSQQP